MNFINEYFLKWKASIWLVLQDVDHNNSVIRNHKEKASEVPKEPHVECNEQKIKEVPLYS